ncbi:hypothetical protein ACFFTM_04210 [Pseudoduganella plicata]|uniref:TonB C-terminal domain-containing protein n=1 Tax=Pseudoduganella plicata TaxID=321984 RepID=A0A4P7BIY9_9BURK|nr:hypothetical protein [Pseudoduganella plicata]QBQ38866.1 hypothetical protein E1742_23915 [Pseudoduganella plicata]GGZ09624.1 hypothetical protein GCM10007388_48990 [Pseudoduganella plicata]
MRTNMFKLGAIAALAILAGCQTAPQQGSSQQNEAPPPANPAFTGEMAKFNAQFPNDKATKYEDVSIKFNNDKKLDERGNCHDKSKYPVTIVLTLDADGKVTDSVTDVSNAKAECFRKAYAGVQFPKPPMAPYRKPIQLR